jgi:tRNA threonylcarbamoyladenosine biosynthesis protein TsaE
MMVNFTLDNIAEAAATFLSAIENNKVIAFHGEMGAGKTTFIHALCQTMGVRDAVSSPTFSIINQYSGSGGQTIYHLDLYRVKDEEEAINAGVEECFYSGDTCLVEWPEKAQGIFPDNTLHVSISAVDTNTRKLQINL